MNILYSYLQKAKRSLCNLLEIPAESIDFGLRFAFWHNFYKTILHWTDSPKIYACKHQLILSYLEADLSEIVREIQSSNLINNNEPVRKIWVFWYQGLEKAPEIVRKCRELLKKTYSDSYKIIELDSDNYSQYCKLPDFVTQKVKEGKISLTEFSDILRTKLLYENGGMWVDSTLLVQGKVEDKYLDLPFYTIRIHGDAPYCVSGVRLSTYYQYYKQNNNYVGFLSKLLLAYWEKHNVLMEYLLMDYFMILIANNNIQFDNMLNDVPFTNPNVHMLRNHINDTFSEVEWKRITSGTHFFKMTYKMALRKIGNDGKQTNYGHIIDDL